MPNSSSFIINQRTLYNQVCFASAIYCKEHNELNSFSIIIEKNKQFYPKEEMLKYIDIISELTNGTIKSVSIGKEEEIIIEMNVESNVNFLRYASITIRYLWEGRFSKTDDNFYLIFERFMKMIDYFPNIDKGVLFSIAHNIFSKNANFYNSNHCISEPSGHKILSQKEITKLLEQDERIWMTSTFSTSIPKISVPENKEDYEKLIQQFTT